MTFLASVALKMAVVAAVVVVATMVAERTRPIFAALIATLPLSVGAAYVLMALEQDAAFVSTAALTSVAGAASTVVFIATYAHAALRCAPPLALGLAFLAWAPFALFVYVVAWTPANATAFAAAVLAAAFVLTFRLRALRALRPARRYWFDAPLRALSVALFVAVLTAFSQTLGATGVGTLANFPIIMSSVGLILHIRLGPEGAAGMLANSVAGMVGVCLGLMAVHLTIQPLGALAALLLGLGICIVWNASLFALSRRGAVRSA